MAIKHKMESREMLHPVWSPVAALLSGLLSIGGIVAATMHIVQYPEQPAGAIGVLAGWAGLLLVTLICAVQMLRGRIWAHQVQLVFWLAMSLAGILFGLAAFLADKIAWWPEQLGWTPLQAAIPVAAIAASMVTAMVLASRQRLRFASVVSVSIAAALGLIVLANMIFHKDYYRRNMEVLGRYSISKRTETILRGIDANTPLKLTCIYTSVEEGTKGDEYGPQVLELLNEMQEYGRRTGKSIEVANIKTDLEKAHVVAALRKRVGGQAQQHVQVLKDFVKQSEQLIAQAQRLGNEISQSGTYLDKWQLRGQIKTLTGEIAEKIKTTQQEVQRQLDGSDVPDYAKLTQKVRETLEPSQKDLQSVARFLKDISKIAPLVGKNKTAVLEDLSKATEAVSKINDAIKSETSDPTATTKAFIEQAKLATTLLQKAAESADKLAGDELARYLMVSNNWQVRVPLSGGLATQMSIGEHLLQLADVLRQQQAGMERILARKLLAESQSQEFATAIKTIRQSTAALLKMLAGTRAQMMQAITEFTSVDGPTQRLLTSAAEGKFLSELTGPMQKLVKQIESLPEIKEDSIADQITEENIILVEAGNKTAVISFNDVWPLRFQPIGMAAPSGEQRRVFNGDSVISSKILEMTHKPFGKVVLAYIPSQRPRNPMYFQQPQPDPRSLFTTVRKRLEQANFVVEDWDLSAELDGEKAQAETEQAESQPASQATAGKNKQSRVIIVLPTLPPNQMNNQHLANLRKEIDAGTPALFLVTPKLSRMPMGMPLLGGYLSNAWGIDVRNDYMVISAIRDDVDPRRFQINDAKLQWMALNNFSDHPVGKPLQAQRFLCSAMTCPVQPADKAPEGIEVKSLLSTAANQTDTWATGRIEKLFEQFRSSPGSYVSPDYSADFMPDMKSPFSLACAAVRSGTAKNEVKPNRIVVLGMAISLMDSYVNESIVLRDNKGTVSLADPPKLNPDIVVNSAYWLTGLDSRIAAGPAVFKPINITPAEQTQYMLIVAIGLPLIVLILGGCVMWARNRS